MVYEVYLSFFSLFFRVIVVLNSFNYFLVHGNVMI